MRRSAIRFFSLVAFLFVTVHAESQEPIRESPADAELAQNNPDFLAIRTAADKYAEAYNSGQAEKIAELYTENAELIDTNETAYRGRADIQSEYDAFFQLHPEASISMVVEKVNFVAPNVAIEEGQTASKLTPNSETSFSRYVAVYTKIEDEWLISYIRDEEIQGESGAKLEELNWLIGRWVDEADDSLMQIDCYWDESGSYLIRDFKIEIEGLLASSGTERIGWDPLQKKVRSWLFDSEGGFLEGTWVKQGDEWAIATHGFRSDGVPTHATYTVTPLRDDAYHLEATGRTTGEQELEDFEMTVVKRPPAPGDLPALSGSEEKPSTIVKPESK